jgi:hypothetical protein
MVPACYGYAPNLSCKYGISLKNACNLAFSALATKGFPGLLKAKKAKAISHIRLLNVGHPRPLQPATATNKPLGDTKYIQIPSFDVKIGRLFWETTFTV